VVAMTNHRKRFAFTMIELIFAIVIIAISVMSLPMMAVVTQRGMENNIVQEAIFAASAELMGATSGYWDENSMQDINVSHLSRVINIGNDCNSTTNLRLGHINQPYHRRCLDNNETIAFNLQGGAVSDLNDAAHGSQSIFLNQTPTASGYKDDYNSTLSVSVSAADANVKDINVTVTNTAGKVVTILKAKSANIGEIDYYRRTF